jgi:drug/metabolite transporter (DMT)-like permease
VAPLPLAGITTALAAVVAVTWYFSARAAAVVRSGRDRQGLARVAVVGALGSGIVVLLSIFAMTGTTATNRALFQSMYPVATAVFARILLGEKLGAATYAVIAVMTAGLFLMNSSGGGVVLGPPFFLLAATLPLIGLADVYAKRSLADADPLFVAVGRLVAGSLVIGLVLPFASVPDWVTVLHAWPWVLLAGCAMAGGILGLYRAMDTAGASLAAAFAGLAPVVTAGLEWALLGAVFLPIQLAGIAVVIAGAVILAYRI